MNLILLSGGSGKRLWPLSNDSRSKQFLKLLKNENDILESMAQRVWGQLKKMELTSSTVIATSKAQVDIIQNQLGKETELVIEPSRRDTFAAISLAATYMKSVKKVNLDEIVTVLPVDPYVQIDFFEYVKELEKIIQSETADIGLIGVAPTYPSSKYGYIIPEANFNGSYIKVDGFIEKPTEKEASNLIEKGSLWNCGVFSFKLSFVINILEKKGFPTNYQDLLEQYEQLPSISFDYEVVEKTKDIKAIRYEGSWKDLGTWNTLTEEMDNLQVGNAVISHDSENTHIINELDIPVAVLGISNLIVAVSPDGILVSDKLASHRVKEVLNNQNNRPMYEERRWGWYKVLDFTKVDNNTEVLTKRIGVKAGKNLSYQVHYSRSEVWTIIKGEGEFVLNDKISLVKPGDVLIIPKEAKHGIKAISDLEFIEVQTGFPLVEEDIIRIFMTWEEVEKYCKDKEGIRL